MGLGGIASSFLPLSFHSDVDADVRSKWHSIKHVGICALYLIFNML